MFVYLNKNNYVLYVSPKKETEDAIFIKLPPDFAEQEIEEIQKWKMEDGKLVYSPQKEENQCEKWVKVNNERTFV